MKMTYIVMGILASFALAGCAANDAKPLPKQDALYKACNEPRPQICTREYRPVCGTRDTGIRCVTTPCASQEHKTYGNACTACSDPKVIEYRSGECNTPKSISK